MGEIRTDGLRLDVPVPGSLDLPALLLTVAALIAVFRFRLGPVPVILGAAAAGLLYGLARGAL